MAFLSNMFNMESVVGKEFTDVQQSAGALIKAKEEKREDLQTLEYTSHVELLLEQVQKILELTTSDIGPKKKKAGKYQALTTVSEHDIVDEYERSLTDILLLLQQIHNQVNERLDIREKKGNCREAIKMIQDITVLISKCETGFASSAKTYTYQYKNRGKLQISDAAFDEKYTKLGKIKQHIQFVKAHDIRNNKIIPFETYVVQNGIVTEPELEQQFLCSIDEKKKKLIEKRTTLGCVTLTDATMYSKGMGGITGDHEEADDEETNATIKKWNERDAKFDQQLKEIGEAVDQIGQYAETAGMKVQEQSELIAALNINADTANEELVAMNAQVKNLIMADSSSTLCLKLLLTVVFVTELCLIFSVMYNKFFIN